MTRITKIDPITASEMPNLTTKDFNDRLQHLRETGAAIIEMLKNGMSDKQIANSLGTSVDRVSWYRKALGIFKTSGGTRRNLLEDWAMVSIDKNSMRISCMTITSIVGELGLDLKKRYKYKVKSVKPKEFVIEIKEV